MFKKLLLVAFLVLGINLLANENSFLSESTANDAVFKSEMLKMVNQIRSQGCRCGNWIMPPVAPLQWNNKLEKAAKAHAKDMNSNKFFGHRGSDGSKIGERIAAADYYWKAVAENVSWGHRTIEGAVRGWKNSPSHCMTLMSPDYKEMGAANDGKFWVQEFGQKMY
jgi:uncharacterized protein YkwD